MKRKPYPSDLTDAQWERVAPLIPPARSGKQGGRKRTANMREVLNAIFYLLRTGCPWRYLPHEFPPWGTVHYYYWLWRREGSWQQIHDPLRTQVRLAAGREPSPSAAILDSQSVKTTEERGIAAGMRARR